MKWYERTHVTKHQEEYGKTMMGPNHRGAIESRMQKEIEKAAKHGWAVGSVEETSKGATVGKVLLKGVGGFYGNTKFLVTYTRDLDSER